MKIYSVFEKDIYCNNPVTKGNKVDIYIRDAVDKEIERLWKEKEWLLHDNAQSEYWCSGRTTLEKCRERIIMRMQQELEEE